MAKKNDYMVIRVSEQLKRDFEDFCESTGMTVSTAINLLVQHTIRKKEIPFQVVPVANSPRSENGKKVEGPRFIVRVDWETRQEFKNVCDSLGLSMSRIVKMYMLNCVNMGKLPF